MIYRYSWRQYTDLFRFFIVGVINTAFYAALLFLFVEIFFLYVTISNIIAFIIVNTTSYILHTKFTFQKNTSINSYKRFVFVSITALIAIGSISFAAEAFGLNYWVGFLLIVILLPLVSYIAMRIWVFGFE